MARTRRARRRPGWRRLPTAALAGGAGRVALLAGAISAAKVALFAVGGGVFLAAHPVQALAWVYILLAVVAAGCVCAVLPYLERARPVAATGWLLAMTAVLALAAAAALALALPGTPLALLVLAHLYNIASEILLWLVAAACLPAPELRRATVWIYLATALGGFVGGLGVERLLAFGPAVALFAGTLAALLCAGWALLVVARTPAPADGGSGTVEVGTDRPAASWGALLAHPLGVPLGAASFMLTFVWVLTEFLCLARYQMLGLGPDALGRLLAAIYALLQLVEFATIALLAAPVTRRVPPLWRSVIFPGGALLTLLWMGREPQNLYATVVAHAYTESASNALFDPVHASNFAAAPLRLQPRLRTLADGVCYPLGMAAGGLVLLLAPAEVPTVEALQPIATTASAAAMLFVAVGVFTGVMIAPSLLVALGLTTDVGPAPGRAELRAALRALRPWVRRARLRNRLVLARADAVGSARTRRRVDLADRRALRQAFAQARRCDQGGAVRQLEVLLDSCNPELRALVVEALLSLPVRGLFLPFLPALRRRYLA